MYDTELLAMFLKWHKKLGELFLVVYHVNEPDTPIQKRDITEGFPELPLLNPLTRDLISDPAELRYDFCFEPFENGQDDQN